MARIGELLDTHLGKGDLIFFDWVPPTQNDGKCKPGSSKFRPCARHGGVDLLCCGDPAGSVQAAGLARLGELARARGASLVLTTGKLKPSKRRVQMMRKLAAEEPAVFYWHIDDPFCDVCSVAEDKLLIPGTNLSVYFSRGGRVDTQHVTKAAAAFGAPFLCSFLQSHSLLHDPPTRMIEEFRHEGVRVDMAGMRNGSADQYLCRIFERPAHLRGSAITAMEHAFQPTAHRGMIHHTLLRFCTQCPMLAVGEHQSFSCPPAIMRSRMPMCFPNMLHTLSEHQMPMTFPTGVGIPLPDHAPCILLETHYTFPPLLEPWRAEKEKLRKVPPPRPACADRPPVRKSVALDGFRSCLEG